MSGHRILFLDHTAALGGGELALRDVVTPYRDRCRVVLFADGPLRPLLEADGVPVTVEAAGLAAVRRESGVLRGVTALPDAVGLVRRIAGLAREHDLLYANSQKALLVGAAAARLTGVPLVSHLHDILSPEHFSASNRRLSVAAANLAGRAVIANSEATAAAFVVAGGRRALVEVVHYGFAPAAPAVPGRRDATRAELGIPDDAFVVSHVGRLSPWKGQDVFLRALAEVPDIHGVVVGEALFGEGRLADDLRRLADGLGVGDRVVFTGFRDDVVDLMRAGDLLVHASTSPEPFGRVIVEAMLAGVPVVAARAGGPCEIIEEGRTGWLTEPGDVGGLAARIGACRSDAGSLRRTADAAADMAGRRFTLEAMHAGIAAVVDRAIGGPAGGRG